jgi:hypothetical protein
LVIQTALTGTAGMGSAQELAQKYMQNEESKPDKVNSLIRWQYAKSGTSGFITGVGELLTLTVAIPANLASVLYIQFRMVAAIALLGGHDLRETRIKSLEFTCLSGKFEAGILHETSIVFAT